MARRFVLVLVVLTASLLAVVVSTAVQKLEAMGPVYAPGQVKAGLLGAPQVWVGRIVLVRGTLVGLRSLGLVSSPYYVLQPPLPHAPGLRAPAYSGALLVQPQASSSFMSLLRDLPLVSQLFPSPQQANNPVTAVYRVQLLAPGQSCTWMDAQHVCYDAALTDFQP